MVHWKMLTRRNLWLTAGITVLLGVCGCGERCPRDSAYREPAAWLATHALISEMVALPESAAACFGDTPAVQVPPEADAFDLLSLLDDRRPDYLVAGNEIVWGSLRGQPWFSQRYQPVANWRHVYPIAVDLTLYAYTPSPFDLGTDLPAPGEFVTDAAVLRSYRLSSFTATPDVPLYLTLLWDDVTGQDYAGLTVSVRLVAENGGRVWHVSQSGFEPSGLTFGGDSRLAQRYVVTPPDDLPQGAYDLRLTLREASGRPVPVLGSDGETREDLLLATVVHPPDVDQAPIRMDYDVDYRLGDPQGRIRLAGFDAPLRARPGDDLRVALLWTPSEEIPQSYRVFVHVLTADDTLVTQSDGIPVYGFYPTPDWHPGDFVRDEHLLTLPEGLPRGD
ncbi:MAG: hypothetical protein J7M39_05575, partial [Anaerolineae bacterium]|nr:hypothetical protein [Anaerolineae bacterium]